MLHLIFICIHTILRCSVLKPNKRLIPFAITEIKPLTDKYEVDSGLSAPISRQLTCPSLKYPAQNHSDPLDTDNLKSLITGQLFNSPLDKINQTPIRHFKLTFSGTQGKDNALMALKMYHYLHLFKKADKAQCPTSNYFQSTRSLSRTRTKKPEMNKAGKAGLLCSQHHPD